MDKKMNATTVLRASTGLRMNKMMISFQASGS